MSAGGGQRIRRTWVATRFAGGFCQITGEVEHMSAAQIRCCRGRPPTTSTRQTATHLRDWPPPAPQLSRGMFSTPLTPTRNHDFLKKNRSKGRNDGAVRSKPGIRRRWRCRRNPAQPRRCARRWAPSVDEVSWHLQSAPVFSCRFPDNGGDLPADARSFSGSDSNDGCCRDSAC